MALALVWDPAKAAAHLRKQGVSFPDVVVLGPDVAKGFADSRAVNRALRALLDAPPSRPERRARSAI